MPSPAKTLAYSPGPEAVWVRPVTSTEITVLRRLNPVLSAGAVWANDAVMVCQVRRTSWRSSRHQIRGRSNQEFRQRGEHLCPERGVGKLPEADGNVHTLGYKNLIEVRHQQFHTKQLVAIQENRQARDNLALTNTTGSATRMVPRR